MLKPIWIGLSKKAFLCLTLKDCNVGFYFFRLDFLMSSQNMSGAVAQAAETYLALCTCEWFLGCLFMYPQVVLKISEELEISVTNLAHSTWRAVFVFILMLWNRIVDDDLLCFLLCSLVVTFTYMAFTVGFCCEGKITDLAGIGTFSTVCSHVANKGTLIGTCVVT